MSEPVCQVPSWSCVFISVQSVPFHSISTHSIVLQSTPFHSIPLYFNKCLLETHLWTQQTVLFDSLIFPSILSLPIWFLLTTKSNSFVFSLISLPLSNSTSLGEALGKLCPTNWTLLLTFRTASEKSPELKLLCCRQSVGILTVIILHETGLLCVLGMSQNKELSTRYQALPW